VKQTVLGVLGIPRESRNERYLGLPVHLGASKSKEFEYLKEKIWQHIQGWKEKILSKAGKEILIKAVAQAIPTYAMSCFDLTKSLCDDISAMICRYWWNKQDGKKKCHWLSWDQMTRAKHDGGMGFRDLHIFNMAMLARQGWRLLQNPDSLCCTVLKAMYYPDCSILEATPQKTMSYTWRSILRGIALLKEGIIWRVGSGESIDAWKDPWIPSGSTCRVRTPDEMEEPVMVSDLIDHGTTQWDEDVLRAIFLEEDVEEILKIPLRQGMEDSVAWSLDKKGVFSVKSAYRLGVDLRERRHQNDTSTSSVVVGVSQIWDKIWSLKLPGKVRVFLWRLTHNSLPLRMNIKRKKVELDTRCPMCCRLDEDGGHLFFKCKRVKQVWRSMLMEDVRLQLAAAPDARLMMEGVWELTREKQNLAAILLWDWWTVRNKVNAGEMEKSTGEVCSMIQKHYLEFTKGMNTEHTVAAMHDIVAHPATAHWVIPAENKVKVNFDASFRDETRDGAWGFIARSDTGEFIGAAAGKLRHLRDALQAEAEACSAAIEGANALGLHRVVFESDSQILVKALTSTSHELAEIGVLLREIRSSCISSFDSFEFSFCPRRCNKVAHSLAQFGYRDESECNGWADHAPPFVSELVASDLAEHYG
jgi:ribonuclease HI